MCWKKKCVCGWKKRRFHTEDDCLAHVEIHACFHFPENQWRFDGFDSKILQGLVCHFLYFFFKGWDFIFWLWLNDNHAQLPRSFNHFCNNMEVSQYSVSNTVNSWLSVGGLPCCLRWQIICLQSRRSSVDPWVRKLLWRREWLPLSILAWRIPWTEEPDRQQSVKSQRVGHDWATNSFHFSLSLSAGNTICKICFKSLIKLMDLLFFFLSQFKKNSS